MTSIHNKSNLRNAFLETYFWFEIHQVFCIKLENDIFHSVQHGLDNVKMSENKV